MSGPKLKLRREPVTLPNLDEFSHISRFSVARASLYQALSVGIFEILIRFRLSANYVRTLKVSLEDLKHKAIALGRERNLEDHFI